MHDIPVLGICYDFDKTLSPEDMQAQGFIQTMGYYDPKTFWVESNKLAEDHKMDQNCAWMYEMMARAEGKELFIRDKLKEYGKKIKFFPGVEEWFDRIVGYGEAAGVKVEHYIISSGLKEMIEGSSIGSKFTDIFASSFYYDDKTGVGRWPAQVVNFANKTQFLFRIKKGIHDVNSQDVNDQYPHEKIRIPFRNMVYIGDSETDVACMEVVNSHGGYSIGVYDPFKNDRKRVYKMIREERIKYFAPADYSEGKELDTLVKAIIERTAKNEFLVRKYYSCRYYSCLNEYESYERLKAYSDRIRSNNLILALEDSGSFEQTRAVVRKMKSIKNWTKEEVDDIARIAIENVQVRYVATEYDIKLFFAGIIDGKFSDNIDRLRELINEQPEDDTKE